MFSCYKMLLKNSGSGRIGWPFSHCQLVKWDVIVSVSSICKMVLFLLSQVCTLMFFLNIQQRGVD